MLLVACMLAHAATLPEVPALPELHTESGSLVRGTVVVATSARSWIGLSTRYTVLVDEVLSGSAPDEVALTLPGGKANGLTQVVAGVPRWDVGDEAMLFLDSAGHPTPWTALTITKGKVVDPLARALPAHLRHAAR